MATLSSMLNGSAPQPVSLDGLHVVITGGASGLGLMAAELFLEQKSSVSLLDVNADAASLVVKDLETRFPKGKVGFTACDVSSFESQAAAFKGCWEKHGRVDIVLANAGISRDGVFPAPLSDPLAEPVKPTLKVIDINITGVIFTSHLALHYIRKGGRGGTIICTASIAGLYPFPAGPMYGTSKHAVVGLIRSLAPVLVQENITVNGLAPNFIRTNIAGPQSTVWDRMELTPPSTFCVALKELAIHRGITGAIVEISGPNHYYQSSPEYTNNVSKINLEVCEKLALMGQGRLEDIK